MEKLLYFKLIDCPYCRQADRWLRELVAENPAYRDVVINTVNEAVEVDLANSYDYYYVPTFFLGGRKLHEGVASKEILRRVLDAAVNQ